MGERSSGALWSPELGPGVCPVCGQQSPDDRAHEYHLPRPAKAQKQERLGRIRRRLVGMLRGGRSQTPTCP